jgi:transporter family-2 protein
MLKLASLFPFLVGAAGVVQAALNRRLVPRIGLPAAICLNASIVFGIALILFLNTRSVERWLPADLVRQPDGGALPWWAILPGAFGFAVVAGIPIAVGRLGALTTFTLLVAGQLGASLIWDYSVEGLPITLPRVIGVALALGAVAATSIK